LRKWAWRLLVVVFAGIFLVLFVGVPVGGSFLITNTRFSFPDPGPSDPAVWGLEVTPVEFESEDGIHLQGWWNVGEDPWPVIVFVHGLNRSRIELLERGAESRQRGYGTLLFDLRNHGESDAAYTTLGVDESMDVCAAQSFVESLAPGRPIVLWGVSLGASTALLSANRCSGAIGAVADSSFLSFEETVSHHFELITPLPSFPIADILIAITRLRMDFTLDEADVELSVANHPDLAVLFVAGTNDERMPPDVARRLYAASDNPNSEILMIDGAGHGQAFQEAPRVYLAAVFGFLDRVAPERSE
jgi:alpha-beta hydrolase superfamily lysophospholipase